MNRAWHDPRRITPEIRDGYLRAFRSMNWDRGMWEAARANRAPGLQRKLASLTTRTLVITGDDDRVVPVKQTERLARELPNASLTVIPDCGHIPQEEQPEALFDILMRFIETN